MLLKEAESEIWNVFKWRQTSSKDFVLRQKWEGKKNNRPLLCKYEKSHVTETRVLFLFHKQRGAFCGTWPRPPLSGAGTAIRRSWEQRLPVWALLQPHPAGKPPGTNNGETPQSSISVSGLVRPDQCPSPQRPDEHHFKMCSKDEEEQIATVFADRSDMHRWMAAFPNPTNPDRDEDEVIYEDWGEDYSHTTACVCVSHLQCLTPVCVCVCQTVLRCSVWSSTLPSRQTS